MSGILGNQVGLATPASTANEAAVLAGIQSVSKSNPWYLTGGTGTYANGPARPAAFAGGVLLPDGRVLLVPYSSTTIGLYDPVNNTYTNGPVHGQGSFAFWGGVLLSDGRVLLVPFISTVVGLYNPVTNTYTDGPVTGNNFFLGGVLMSDGRVLLVPYSSTTIGLYDPAGTIGTYTNGPVHGRGSNAFWGGVLLPDGRVLLVPHTSTTIGLYDPVTNTYTDGPVPACTTLSRIPTQSARSTGGGPLPSPAAS
jgi:hypothetical protein